MKALRTALVAVLTITIPWLTTNPVQAQAWPDPQLALISISADSSTFYSDGRLRFTLKINRLNGSTYSDTSRVWICPKTTWDGLYCTAGQFLVSSTPASNQSEFVIESPFLLLADGEYVITAVSFRNGAVVNDYTLIYPRSGVVTIGGIATTIPLINLSSGDFKIAPPAPEPEPTPEPEPQPEPTPEPQPQPQPQPETNSTEPESNTNQTQSETSNNPAPDDSTTESTEPDTTPENNQSNTVEPPNSESINQDSESNPDAESAQSESTTQPNQNESTNLPATNPELTSITNSESTPQPTVVIEVNSIVVIPTKPEVEPVVQPITEPVIETAVTSQIELPTVQGTTPTMTTILLNSAIGGGITKVVGNTKLERSVKAGIGKLSLLGSSNESYLTIKLGKTELAKLDLRTKQRFLISWRATKPATLKLVLTGPNTPELLIDALQQAEKLIANPTFRMRN